MNQLNYILDSAQLCVLREELEESQFEEWTEQGYEFLLAIRNNETIDPKPYQCIDWWNRMLEAFKKCDLAADNSRTGSDDMYLVPGIRSRHIEITDNDDVTYQYTGYWMRANMPTHIKHLLLEYVAKFTTIAMGRNHIQLVWTIEDFDIWKNKFLNDELTETLMLAFYRLKSDKFPYTWIEDGETVPVIMSLEKCTDEGATDETVLMYPSIHLPFHTLEPVETTITDLGIFVTQGAMKMFVFPGWSEI